MTLSRWRVDIGTLVNGEMPRARFNLRYAGAIAIASADVLRIATRDDRPHRSKSGACMTPVRGRQTLRRLLPSLYFQGLLLNEDQVTAFL
jgi:hypothetical protein